MSIALLWLFERWSQTATTAQTLPRPRFGEELSFGFEPIGTDVAG